MGSSRLQFKSAHRSLVSAFCLLLSDTNKAILIRAPLLLIIQSIDSI